MVDMEFLACKNISVSFVVVNDDGLSQYSPEIGFCVTGGIKQLAEFSFSETEKLPLLVVLSLNTRD